MDKVLSFTYTRLSDLNTVDSPSLLPNRYRQLLNIKLKLIRNGAGIIFIMQTIKCEMH